jgi:hypothetical protein
MTESDWWALCDADPGALPWYALADWLLERADPRADAAREAGRRGWAPRYSRAFGTWDWWDVAAGATPAGPEDLPHDVFARLHDDLPPEPGEDPPDGWRSYPSASAACRALLDALAHAPPGAV